MIPPIDEVEITSSYVIREGAIGISAKEACKEVK
jgi:hypothetical protein